MFRREPNIFEFVGLPQTRLAAEHFLDERRKHYKKLHDTVIIDSKAELIYLYVWSFGGRTHGDL